MRIGVFGFVGLSRDRLLRVEAIQTGSGFLEREVKTFGNRRHEWLLLLAQELFVRRVLGL